MADYYPLIAKAVAGLDESTGEARRALYERARTALHQQLRGVDPALSEPDITRERLALEEAIRKVESEAVAYQRAGDPRRRLEPQQARGDVAVVQDYAESDEARRVPLSAGAAARAPDGDVRRWNPGGASLPVRSLRERLDPARDGAAVRAYPADRDYRRLERSPGRWTEDGEQGPEPPLPRIVARPIAPVEEPGGGRSRALQSYPRRPEQQRALAERVAPLHPHPADTAWNAPRNSNRAVAIVVIALLVAGISGAAYLFGDEIMTALRGAPGKLADANAPADSLRASKFGERAPSALTAATENLSLAGQKVVLYEEDPYNPNGAQFVGTAHWRTERIDPGAGKRQEVVIHGDIDIPDQKMSLNLTLSHNEDKGLPASHTVEIKFELPQDFSHGGIASIPGIMVKQGETNRGIALNGMAVKVVDNFFLVGLSLADGEMQRNVQLLKERTWFDIPIVYADGKRALIAIEKGPSGERAFAEAFGEWDQL